ncbi:MAG: hypothetical protein RLZZ540_100 [Bacteroidota bacterium]|jgi:flagellar biosynthesis regulator FlaF
MRKKDSEKIFKELKETVKAKLLNNFKNRDGHIIDTVESINIQNFETDEKNEDRDKIIVTNVNITSRVFVKFVEDSRSSDNLQLGSNKSIEFVYNKETDEFDIIANDVVFYINSSY